MVTLRLTLALALALAGWSIAQAQIGTAPGKQSPPLKPNEHIKDGVPSMFATGGSSQFHSPTGAAGSKANVFTGPAVGYAGRPQPPVQTPSFWQRFKNFFGFRDPIPAGTVPQQIPPGSVDPKIFGGR
jgi:hypothetical protein